MTVNVHMHHLLSSAWGIHMIDSFHIQHLMSSACTSPGTDFDSIYTLLLIRSSHSPLKYWIEDALKDRHNISHSMGKLRKSVVGTKTRVFESSIVHTRRGPRLRNIPISTPTSPQGPSRSSSPTKKRARTPDIYQPNKESTDSLPLPNKRSRQSGKVIILFNGSLGSAEEFE